MKLIWKWSEFSKSKISIWWIYKEKYYQLRIKWRIEFWLQHYNSKQEVPYIINL